MCFSFGFGTLSGLKLRILRLGWGLFEAGVEAFTKVSSCVMVQSLQRLLCSRVPLTVPALFRAHLESETVWDAGL